MWASALALFSSVAVSLAATNRVTIVDAGKSDWRIVCPPPGSPATAFGARELQAHIRLMTGCSLPIVNRTLIKPALTVGIRNELSPTDRGMLPPAPQGYDGYAIAIQEATRKTPARVVIGAETGRGVVYGVYDLLQRLGCRWSTALPDGTNSDIVPRNATLSLPLQKWTAAFPTQFRTSENNWAASAGTLPIRQFDWVMKARQNSIGWPGDDGYRPLPAHDWLLELGRREMFLRITVRSNHVYWPPADYLKQSRGDGP